MAWYPQCLLENRKDGGYTLIVILASFLTRTLLFGMVYASGVYYVEVLDELRTSKGLTAWVGSLHIACVSMASIISSALHNRYGARPTTALSALIASTGLISSAITPNIYFLIISYGVVTGVGLGICLIPSVILVTDYTDRWKHIAQSVASSGSSFGTFLGPLVVERLIAYYGWRGSLIICSAIVLNIGVIGQLFRPFDDTEKRPLVCAQNSLMSLQVMNWSLLRHGGFLLVCFTLSFMCFANSVILIHVSAFTQLDRGLSAQRAAALISLIGAMGIGSRLLFGVAISRGVPPFLVIVLTGLIVGINTIILPTISSYPGLLIYCVITGVFMSSNGGAVLPALLSDLLGEDNLSNSMGILNFLAAVGNLAGPPIAGLIFDKTGEYQYSFTVGGVAALISGIGMILPWRISLHQQHRNIQQRKRENLLVASSNPAGDWKSD